jgi:hypothetical protein
MTMTHLSGSQTRIRVDETYRRNMKNKEPEAVDSASFSGAEFTLPDNVDELSPFCVSRYFGMTLLLKILLNKQAADIQHRTSSSYRFRTDRAI